MLSLINFSHCCIKKIIQFIFWIFLLLFFLLFLNKLIKYHLRSIVFEFLFNLQLSLLFNFFFINFKYKFHFYHPPPRALHNVIESSTSIRSISRTGRLPFSNSLSISRVFKREIRPISNLANVWFFIFFIAWILFSRICFCFLRFFNQ